MTHADLQSAEAYRFVCSGWDEGIVYGAWIPTPEWQKTWAVARYLASRAMEAHQGQHELICEELAEAIMPYLFPDWEERRGRHEWGVGMVVTDSLLLTTAECIGAPLREALRKGHTPLKEAQKYEPTPIEDFDF